jgi:hypothetical protein
MERMSRPGQRSEALRSRRESISSLVAEISERNDAELSYHCLVLNYLELTDNERKKLVNIICETPNGSGEEVAFRTLLKQPELDEPLRDALLERIVASADKTTCSMTLQWISRLGPWEQRLKSVLLR